MSTYASSDNVNIVTVSDEAIPSRCVWSLSIANGLGCLVRSTYNSKYLYSDGISLYTSATTGTAGTSTYYSRVWRVAKTTSYGNTSSHDSRELNGVSIDTLILNVGDSKTPTITKTPTNAVWADVSDFTFSYNSGTSNCVTVSLPTNVFSSAKCGIATYTATHKVTGRQVTFKVYVDRYTYELTREFGFEDDDALLIRALYDKVDAAYPYYNDDYFRAWIYARLLGGIIYGNNDLRWIQIAGQVFSGSQETYFINTLGYTADEYERLIAAVGGNYNDASTADFAHLQIYMAARLAYALEIDGLAADIGGVFFGEDISYYAGWLGDATLKQNNGTTSIGNDDYHADLDAENIYRLIMQGQSAVDAINGYYASLTPTNTRAIIFLSYISYSTIESKIYSILTDDEEEIREEYADTYNFMHSVKTGLADIRTF